MGNTVIQLRNDTASNWTINNPTLAQGEMGLETDTNKFKFGDGSTAWNSLAYAGGSASAFKYGLYTLSANQTSNLSVGNHLEWNTCQGSLGGLSTGSGQENGIITLAGGKKYIATFSVGMVGTGSSQVIYQTYNRTSSNYIGAPLHWIPAISGGSASTTSPMSIFTTSVDTDIDVRITDQDISYIISSDAWLLIEEYGGY